MHIGFRYQDLNRALQERIDSYEALNKLFNYLLIRTHGDAEEAIDIMHMLQERGRISADMDLDAFEDQLREQSLIQQAPDGSTSLTDKGVQGMRKASLEWIFRDLDAGEEGDHSTQYSGGANEPLPERRAYQFGDDLRSIDFNESILNMVRRTGESTAGLHEQDLVVNDAAFNTSCATVLLLDVSHSMILYGEDRFTPAKQVALALTELILKRFKKDSLDIVLFGNEAIPVPIKELPYAQVGPFHTNTKAGLAHARKILERRKNPNKQIIMVTDGKPTVINVPGEGIYRNTFGMDERIINRTLDEAVVCKRRGIAITTFMVTRDPWLEQFVERLTELNQGKAYFTDPNKLGGFVMADFIRNRRRKA